MRSRPAVKARRQGPHETETDITSNASCTPVLAPDASIKYKAVLAVSISTTILLHKAISLAAMMRSGRTWWTVTDRHRPHPSLDGIHETTPRTRSAGSARRPLDTPGDSDRYGDAPGASRNHGSAGDRAGAGQGIPGLGSGQFQRRGMARPPAGPDALPPSPSG